MSKCRFAATIRVIPARTRYFPRRKCERTMPLVGYLYVVLGGKTYDELVNTLRGSYVRKTGLFAIVALVAVGAAAGLLAFGLATRRLRRLTGAVQEFSRNDFTARDQRLAAVGVGRRDRSARQCLSRHGGADSRAGGPAAGERPAAPRARVQCLARFTHAACFDAGLPRDAPHQERRVVASRA